MEWAVMFVVCVVLLCIYTAVKPRTRGEPMPSCMVPHCNRQDGLPIWQRSNEECDALVLFFGFKRTDVLCGACVKTLLWLKERMIIDLKESDDAI